MVDLIVTPSARQDLLDILAYIEKESGDKATAMRVVDKISKTIRLLQEQPHMGPRLTAQVKIISDYRYLVCANYYAFYKYMGNEVRIIRVLHCTRDYMRILFGVTQKTSEN